MLGTKNFVPIRFGAKRNPCQRFCQKTGQLATDSCPSEEANWMGQLRIEFKDQPEYIRIELVGREAERVEGARFRGDGFRVFPRLQRHLNETSTLEELPNA